jgi:hypothetical protein
MAVAAMAMSIFGLRRAAETMSEIMKYLTDWLKKQLPKYLLTTRYDASRRGARIAARGLAARVHLRANDRPRSATAARAHTWATTPGFSTQG